MLIDLTPYTEISTPVLIKEQEGAANFARVVVFTCSFACSFSHSMNMSRTTLMPPPLPRHGQSTGREE